LQIHQITKSIQSRSEATEKAACRPVFAQQSPDASSSSEAALQQLVDRIVFGYKNLQHQRPSDVCSIGKAGVKTGNTGSSDGLSPSQIEKKMWHPSRVPLSSMVAFHYLTRRIVMANPRPVPPYLRVVEPSACVKDQR